MRIGANALSSSSRASMSRMATVLLAVTLAGLLTLSGSRAAFSDTTNNSIATGTVTLIDDDTGLAMFSVTDMAPLASAIECIEDEYARSLPSLNPVVLYAGANGAGDTGLGTYLDLKIEVGIGHVILFETPRDPTYSPPTASPPSIHKRDCLSPAATLTRDTDSNRVPFDSV